jgi:hypothetical protein
MKKSAQMFLATLFLSACRVGSAPEASAQSDKDELLRAMVHDVITNPALQHTREVYGTPGDRKLALVSNSKCGIPWPTNFNPQVDGYQVVTVLEDDKNRDWSGPHILGIRIDRLDFAGERQRPNSPGAPLQITVLNAGGVGTQAVMGGCVVYYNPKKHNAKWSVEFACASDP